MRAWDVIKNQKALHAVVVWRRWEVLCLVFLIYYFCVVLKPVGGEESEMITWDQEQTQSSAVALIG